MKRRNFLLLEVLIALALVALFAPLLMRLPLGQYKAQVRQLETYEQQRLADLAFSEIKEQLLKQSIPWKALPAKGTKSRRMPLPPGSIRLPHFPAKSLNRSFTLKCIGEKQGRSGVYRMYRVDVYVGNGDAPFADYRILVQRVSAK
jgi:type II secretory pathway pseudopilin PulG